MRFSPCVAICLRLRDRRRSMLSRHLILSNRHENISFPCRLQCAQSHMKQRVESYRKLAALPSDHHHVLNSVQCQSSLRYVQPHVRHHLSAWLQEEARYRWWTTFTSKVLIPHVPVGLTILSYQLIWKITEDKVDTQRQIRFGHAEKMSSSQGGL